MNKRGIILFTVITGILGSAPLWATDDGPAKVLSDLHHANQAEIHMGKMAQEKGQSEQVKAYGARLVKDHQEADQQVMALAKKDGIALETPAEEGMMASHEASKANKTMTKLDGKSGKDFDKAFVEAMEDDHKKDISKLEKAEKSLTQADIKELVAKLLPTLKEHLQIAEKLEG